MKKELKIYLASPRGFCAGVKRAIEIVEKAIDKFGTPVYVRHEIVHNKQVVDELLDKAILESKKHYRRFISAMLEITDNIDAQGKIKSPRTFCNKVLSAKVPILTFATKPSILSSITSTTSASISLLFKAELNFSFIFSLVDISYNYKNTNLLYWTSFFKRKKILS